MNDAPLSSKTKYDLLLHAIKHKSYDVFLTNAKTCTPSYNYDDFVFALQVYAAEIEGKLQAGGGVLEILPQLERFPMSLRLMDTQ